MEINASLDIFRKIKISRDKTFFQVSNILALTENMSFEAEYLVTTKWDLTAKLYLGPMAQDLKVKYHLLVTKYSASGDLSIQS